MTKSVVIKSNALIEASYRLSLYEQRIILACIAQLKRDEPLTDQQLYSISAQQIAEMTGTSLGTAYQNLKAAAERLFDRRVTLHEAPNGKGAAAVRLTRWVQEVVYREALGSVSLRFSNAMVPYLSQLTEQFTHYALSDVAKMSSSHAIRLYELLTQWRSVGYREIEIDWLRKAMQLEDSYSNIRDLKRRVLDPAIEQINEHSPIFVSWTQRKTGRKVTHLHFTFAPKEAIPSASVDDSVKPKKRPIITKAEAEKLARAGETYEQLYQRLNSEYIISG